MSALSLVSWNVLADAYIRPELYPHTPPALLEPAARRRRLLDSVASFDADVVCLQEVEPSFFAEAEARLGAFTGFFRNKRHKPDGCAIFVRRSLGAPKPRELYYRDGTGHLALAAELGGVGIVTTHLKWEPHDAPPESRLGAGELRELLDAFVAPGERWVVCGDLNADAASPVLATAFARGLRDAYASMPDAYTCNSNGKRKRIDFILHTPDVVAIPGPLRSIADDTPLPSDEEPSDHIAIRARLEW
jgi:endonuclease/exonuclease/phosphatase family metal-dependent hydrolase